MIELDWLYIEPAVNERRRHTMNYNSDGFEMTKSTGAFTGSLPSEEQGIASHFTQVIRKAEP